MSLLYKLQQSKDFKELETIHTLFFVVEILVFVAGAGAAMYALFISRSQQT